jgi:hypothetical protein
MRQVDAPRHVDALRHSGATTRPAAAPTSTPAIKANRAIGATVKPTGMRHVPVFERCNNLSQCADELVSKYRRENWVETGIYTFFL